MAGFLLSGVGGVLLVMALVDLVALLQHPDAFDKRGFGNFWLALLGSPMLAVGVRLLKLGYLGALTRYVVDETKAPASEVVEDAARAFTRGARNGGQRCPSCGAQNPGGARFCNACGAALVR